MRWEMETRTELACQACGAIAEVGDSKPVACGACGVKAEPDWFRMTPTEDVVEAWYECESCNGRIDEFHKTTMLAAGRHIHEMPGMGVVLADDDPHAIFARVGGAVRRFLPAFRRPLSWHVSALYSPLGWFSWRKAAQQYVDSEKGGYDDESGESLGQVFKNTVLGETHEIEGEQPPTAALQLRAEAYDLGTVPLGALLLVGAVDVQGDRLEVKVKGYGRDQESWLVDYHRIMYPFGAKKPSNETWDQLLSLRAKTYKHEGGGTVGLLAMAIDSGYLTQDVYDFCRQYVRKHFIATKGVGERGKPILGRPTYVDVEFHGRVIKQGVAVWPIGVDAAKELVYSRLSIDKPGPGYMHFPRNLPDEYFEGLTAEKLIRKMSRGVPKNEWVKTRERNEPLDLEVMCQAAAIYAGVQRVNWNDQARRVIPASSEAPAAPKPEAKPARNVFEKPRRGSFATRWRD
jgi:phage terminase large subunit GpA-like protein